MEQEYGTTYEANMVKYESDYATSWGPKKFKKENHPLAIMVYIRAFFESVAHIYIFQVESKRLNLLTHPLVGSLLHHKWKKFGLYGYYFNLLSYCVFLIFLTTFALIIENPRGPGCSNITMNINQTSNSDCGNKIVIIFF